MLVFFARTTPVSAWWAAVAKNVGGSSLRGVKTQDFLKDHSILDYEEMRAKMVLNDPHSVYPTNIYRYSSGTTVSAPDCSTIESLMSLSLSTTIKIKKRVLDPNDLTLADIYKPLGRCVAIVDDKVAGI